MRKTARFTAAERRCACEAEPRTALPSLRACSAEIVIDTSSSRKRRGLSNAPRPVASQAAARSTARARGSAVDADRGLRSHRRVARRRGSTWEQRSAAVVRRFHEAISILHAFERKSQATPKREIEFGVPQPRIRPRMGDRLDRFSTDSLILLLARAGVDVQIRARPRLTGGSARRIG